VATTNHSRPASRASLAEQAYLAIRERILRGQLALGAALSRRRLAEELGMSMLPISEAVQRLEVEGLLESRPQVGTRVRIPAEEDVRESFIIREALESQSARLFAERASFAGRQELGRMAEHVDALFNQCAGGNRDPEFLFAVHSYHFQLHMRITEHSGCFALRAMIEKNNVLVLNWLYDLAGGLPPPPPRFHRELAAVLNTGDPVAADAAMRQHVRWGVEETVQSIRRIRPHSGRKWRLRADDTNLRQPDSASPPLSPAESPSPASLPGDPA
jgi:DNA-binding GntR family transcriptional regulator